MTRTRLVLVASLGSLIARQGRGRKSTAKSGTPDRVAAFIHTRPGTHLRGVARALEMDVKHAKDTLSRLVRKGVLSVQKDGGYERYYPRASEGIPRDAFGVDEKRILAAAGRPKSLAILVVLLDAGAGLPLQAIATGVRAPPSTVAYHLRQLTERGLIERHGVDSAGLARVPTYHIRRPDEVYRILQAQSARSDLVASLVTLWDGLAGQKKATTAEE